MKIFGSFLIVVSAQKGNRASKSFQNCIDAGYDIPLGKDEYYKEPGRIPNGRVDCTGIKCQTTCDSGYDAYYGLKWLKCQWRGAKNGYKWGGRGQSCRTCDPLLIDESDIKKNCVIRSWAKKPLEFCKLKCQDKSLQIKPINKKQAMAICRCQTWPKALRDEDDRCHWRIGSMYIDKIELQDQYMTNYYCNAKVAPPPVVEASLPEEEPEEEIPVSNFIDDARIPPNLICKQQKDVDRIVGGQEAIRNSWPWIMNIKFGGYSCAGTILDDYTVATAAHCCYSSNNNFYSYVSGTIGDHHYFSYDSGQAVYQATAIIIHPDYNKIKITNDLCIVKFPDMRLSERSVAAQACLPVKDSTPSHGTRCWAAGWGVMSDRNPADMLQEVDLLIISDDKCEETENSGHLEKGAHICAGYDKGGKDGCQGDSGGPLICTDGENQPILTGVTSWGFGCGQPNSPGVWTKVSTYVDWIHSKMGPQ